jgi:hypothetical protein
LFFGLDARHATGYRFPFLVNGTDKGRSAVPRPISPFFPATLSQLPALQRKAINTPAGQRPIFGEIVAPAQFCAVEIERSRRRSPSINRIRAASKALGRWFGLRIVADLPLRKEILEDNCKTLCPDCRAGERVRYDPAGVGVWFHPDTKMICGGDPLRKAYRDQLAAGPPSIKGK